MAEKCCACAKEFKQGEDIVTFYFERAKVGEKSGQLGFYGHPSYAQDYLDRVHFNYQCLEKCFSPVDNPFMYDSIALKVRAEVGEDIRQEVLDEISIELEDDIKVPDVDDPPYCLWCKKVDSVWVHINRGGLVYTCTACNKFWDSEENEIPKAA